MFTGCKAFNVPVNIRSRCWVHNLDSLVEYFGPHDRPKFLCTPESPCEFWDGSTHPEIVAADQHTAYPQECVTPWACIVKSSLAHKRKKPRLV